MRYIVRHGQWAGTALEVGRVDRRLIDRFIAEHPEPRPPERRAADLGVEVWADPEATMEDVRDPAYLAEQQAWRIMFGREMLGLLAQAVDVAEEDRTAALLELEELRALGLVEENGKRSLLYHSILGSEEDMAAVVGLVHYNSTVTPRGLQEAADAYGVTWHGRPVSVFSSARGKAQANGVFNDRQTAQWAHYRWPDFCELSGPEQSEEAALHRLTARVAELLTKTR